jgi:hypothetical protein
MAETQAGYTHREWKADMAAIRDVFGGRIAPAMEQMLANLRALDAGRTQMAQFSNALGLVGELATQADQIIDATGARYGGVNEAQAAAGGLPEVYGDKRAHQAG